MKVLIYTHEFPPFLGGLATSSFKLVKGLAAEGFDVVGLVPGYGSDDKTVDAQLPVDVVRIPYLGAKWVKKAPLLQYLLGWLFLNYSLWRHNPDVALFISEEAEVVGGLSFKGDCKFVPRVAGSGITTCFLGKKLLKKVFKFPLTRLYSKSSVIVAVSESTKELLKSVGVGGEKIRVIYNGIDSEMLKTSEGGDLTQVRRRLGIDPDDIVITTVARVLPRKGQDMVIRALPRVLQKFPNVKYVVVGDGRYVENFKTLASELGVEKNVVFAGGVKFENIRDYYDLSYLFIMPNRSWNDKIEGLPNTVLEACARGKPVIAGKHGGSVEAVIDGETGILVDPESIDEIGAAIIELLADEERAGKMGEAGRQMVEERFTQQRMIKEYGLLFHSLNSHK